MILDLTIPSIGVGGGDTKEVGPGEVKADCDEQAPDHEGLLGLHGVSNNVSSGVNDVVFVEPLEVAQVPDCEESEWNNTKDHGHDQFRSSWLLVKGEESDEEYRTDDQWAEQKNCYWDVPPMDVLVQKAIEYFNEEGQAHKDVENTNGDKSALNWETSAAW